MRKSILGSALCYMSIACLLHVAACDGRTAAQRAPEPRGTAIFSQASQEELETVMSSVYLPVVTALAEVFVAMLDSALSNGLCPQVEEADNTLVIRGNGCTALSGYVYEGRLESTGELALDGGAARMTFDEYRRISPAGELYRYDGSIQIRGADDAPVSYEATMLIQTPEVAMAIDVSAFCQLDTRGQPVCLIEPGARADIAGLGSFDIEGSFQWDAQGPVGTLAFYGAEVLRTELLANGCVRYTIDRGVPQRWCPGESDDGLFGTHRYRAEPSIRLVPSHAHGD